MVSERDIELFGAQESAAIAQALRLRWMPQEGRGTAFFSYTYSARTETEARGLEELLVENLVLRASNARLQQGLLELRERVERLEAASEATPVILRDVTREEAREEIRQLFAGNAVLNYEDIVRRLNLDLELVVDICNELIEGEEIGPA